MKELEIVFVKKLGVKKTYNLKMKKAPHNFILANGLVSSNSHAHSYSLTTVREAYLKVNYPLEFMSVALSYEDQTKLKEHLIEIKETGIIINYPDINKSSDIFEINEKDELIFPLSKIKQITDKSLDNIKLNRPYANFDDFMEKVDKRVLNKRKIESLILTSCFQNIDINRVELFKKYHKVYRNNLEEYDDTKFSNSDIIKIEEDLMGFSLSKKSFFNDIKDYVKLYGDSVKLPVELKDNGVPGFFMVVGIIKSIEEKIAQKSGNIYWVVKLTDNEAESKIMIFDSKYMKDLIAKGIYLFDVKINDNGGVFLNTNDKKNCIKRIM